MFEFPVSISRDRWRGPTLLSKWHSDVLLSTSDWPPFYQPSTLVCQLWQLVSQRHLRIADKSSASAVTLSPLLLPLLPSSSPLPPWLLHVIDNVIARHRRHPEAILPSCSCPFPELHTSLPISASRLLQWSCVTSVHLAASTEVASVIAKPLDLESFAAFAQVSTSRWRRFLLIILSQDDVRVTELSSTIQATIPLECRQYPRARSGANLALIYRQNSVREGLRYSTGRTVGHASRHDWGENGTRRYLYTWFDSLPLSQVGAKVDPFIPHYLFDFQADIFAKYFNMYMLLFRFSTCTLNGVNIKIDERWRGIGLFSATCILI